ncbi:MAG TPA: tripartite tricarboxylate transporter substrate binding protein [Burkholderiales bacterium]|nr:tripartite tricarboxylate transporter substrate binding protein [Burkholderiales bacterium]
MFSRLILAALVYAVAQTAVAQQYPTRPIRIIVPFAVGGPSDVMARLVGQKLTEVYGQQVVVDNRVGAGGNIGIGMAARATPDGYTILVVSSAYVVNPGLYTRSSYDPEKSFMPVSKMVASPNAFIAHPTLPAKSMQDLAKLVQASPGKWSMATPGIGTTPDLSAALFKLTTKLDYATVPFNGAGPTIVALLGNQLPVGCAAITPAIPHIQGGRLRALAVTSPKRTPTLPDVPTMAEAGFPGQESDTMQSMLVPTGTPQEIVKRLNADVVKILTQAEMREKLMGLGFDVVASSPEEFARQIRLEVGKWTKVIKQAGIKVE